MARKSSDKQETCVRCGQPARVSIGSGAGKELYCAACADRLTPGFKRASFVLLLQSPALNAEECPACKLSREEMLQTKMAGCPLCYTVFEAELAQIAGI